MSQNDLELARRMLGGDETAFETFFDGHFSRLYRFALPRVGGDRDAAEEVAQSAICKAIGKLASYRGEAMLFTWLCTFCRHEISAWYRRARRQPRPMDLLEDTPETRAVLESLWKAHGEHPDQDLHRQEIIRLVHVVLDQLPPRYASVLEWKYIDGLPVRAICERMDLRLKAAESLLTRARAAFREGFGTISRSLTPRTSSLSKERS